MNEPLLCRFNEKPPLRSFDEKLLRWKAASIKSRFDEKPLHRQMYLIFILHIFLYRPLKAFSGGEF